MTQRRTVLRGIGAGTALLVGGVGVSVADDDTDEQGDGTTAEVRVGHLSPDTPAVDVYVMAPGADPGDDGVDPVVEDLPYGEFAPGAGGSYLGVEAGTYDISVTPAGETSPQAIDVDGFELEANKDYTVLAVGEFSPEADDPGIQALPLVDNGDDETALPPADATLVRFVHASPDAGAVDVAVDGDTVLSGVTFGTASSYLEAPADAEVEVLKGDTTVLGPIDNPFDDGEKGSVYVVGNNTPDEDDPAENDLGVVTTLDATNPGRDRGRDEEDDEEEEDEDEDEGEDEGRGRGRDDEAGEGRGRGRGRGRGGEE